MRPLDRTVVESVCASQKIAPFSRVGAGEGGWGGGGWREEKKNVILAKNVNRFIPSPVKKERVSQVT